MRLHAHDNSRVRILFLAWGYSIHAHRRMKIFVDDPVFDLALASTFNYDFPGVRKLLFRDEKFNRNVVQYDPVKRQPLSHNGANATNAGRLIVKIKEYLRKYKLLVAFFDVLVAFADTARLIMFVRRFKPEVVFLQTMMYPAFLALFLPRKYPLIVTFWNGDILFWAHYKGIERVVKRRIVAAGVRRAEAITVNSEAMLRVCADYGAESEKVHLIRYPGVDLDTFRVRPRVDARMKLDIAASQVVFCPRGLGGYLNSDIILEAASLVIKEYPYCQFMFASAAGGKEELVKHQQMARQYGVERNVRWLGQLPWEEMPLYYAASDLVVSISSEDSLPNCVLEAMACGIPFILGDIPQVRTWAEDGVNCYLVPCRSSGDLARKVMSMLSGCDDNVSRFIQHNMKLVREEFAFQRNVPKIKKLVRDLVKDSPCRRREDV